MITQTHKQNVPAGFTILELTVVMVVGLMIAMITMSLMSQQLATFQILRGQNFMMREAPQVNSLLNRLVSRSDSLLVDQVNDKLTLTFINPIDNSATTAEIVFENGNLVYKGPTSTWNISTQLQNVEFSYDHGVLLITLTGPNDGEIKYSTTPL